MQKNLIALGFVWVFLAFVIGLLIVLVPLKNQQTQLARQVEKHTTTLQRIAPEAPRSETDKLKVEVKVKGSEKVQDIAEVPVKVEVKK